VHEASTMNEQLVNAATKPAPPLKSVLPGVPGPVALLVDRALAFQKADRWPDARTLQEAMRPLLAPPRPDTPPRPDGLPYVRPSSILMAQNDTMAPPVTAEEMAGEVSEPQERRRSGLFVLLALGLAAGIGGGLWVARRGHGEALPSAATAATSVLVQPPPPPAAPPPVAVPPVEANAAAPAPAVTRPQLKPAPPRHDKHRARPAHAPESAGDDIWDRRH
jgi:hypothetical protein